MSAEGNGKQARYFVDLSGQIKQQLKLLIKKAAVRGIEQSFVHALETALRRLQDAPWEFGELIGEHTHLELSEHVALAGFESGLASIASLRLCSSKRWS